MEFLKKNYEKVLLGLVLGGLTLAVCLLPLIIKAKSDALELKRTTRQPHPQPLPALVMTAQDSALQRAQTPPKFDYTTKHNLVNPVVWKKVEGVLKKEETDKAEGPDALVITAIKPLYLEISYGSVSSSGYFIAIDRQAAPDETKRHGLNFLSKDNPKGELVSLIDVKGPPDKPTELDLEWNETSEKFAVTPDKSYKRVDGYMADLKYPPENHTWTSQRVAYRGRPVLNFANGSYNIVGISETNVVVSAKPNEKHTTITFHPAN